MKPGPAPYHLGPAATCLAGLGKLLLMVGCATTSTSNTARTGTEQILISAAIDRAMSTVRFSDFSGQKVFVEEKYLEGVDKGYLVGSIRHRILQAGGTLASSAEAADLVLEVRSGGIGTDTQESFLGIPGIGVPGMPVELPEIKFAERSTQMGTVKLGFVCYDAQTGVPVGAGGSSSALTHNNETFVLGIGPFRNGSVLSEREQSIGFDGVGGSVMSNPSQVVRGQSIPLVESSVASATSPPAPSAPVPLVAETPADMMVR